MVDGWCHDGRAHMLASWPLQSPFPSSNYYDLKISRGHFFPGMSRAKLRSHVLFSTFPRMHTTLSFAMEIIVRFSTPVKFMSGCNMVTTFCFN